LTDSIPLYLAEIVPIHIRGRSVGFCVAGTAAIGVIASTIVWATESIDSKLHYDIPLAIQAGLPGVIALLTLLCTESPTWLALHGRYEEAEASITSLRAINLGLIAREFAHLKVAVEEDRVLRADKSRIWSIFKKENLKRTTTAGALLPLYQVSEVALTNTFSTVILVQSGVSDPFRMTVVINCLAFAGVIISPTLFDTVGRRPVALTGSVIMMLLDFAAGGLACAGLKTQNETLALAGIVVFTFFANACFKPL